MGSQAWKRAEKEAAKVIGGERNLRGGDFSESIPDVKHPLFSVEVKYRQSLPAYFLKLVKLASKQGQPWMILFRGEWVCFQSNDFWEVIGKPIQKHIMITDSDIFALVTRAWVQARDYIHNFESPQEASIPVVFVKQRGMHGQFTFMSLSDFTSLVGQSNLVPAQKPVAPFSFEGMDLGEENEG